MFGRFSRRTVSIATFSLLTAGLLAALAGPAHADHFGGTKECGPLRTVPGTVTCTLTIEIDQLGPGLFSVQLDTAGADFTSYEKTGGTCPGTTVSPVNQDIFNVTTSQSVSNCTIVVTETVTTQTRDPICQTIAVNIAGHEQQVCSAPFEPNLTITKDCAPNNPTPGQQVNCTVTVTNTGNFPATNVTFTDNLPPGVTFVNFSAGDAECDFAEQPDPGPAEITCNVGTLDPGESFQVVYHVRVSETAGPNQGFTNTATVTGGDTTPPPPAQDTVTTPQCTITTTSGTARPNSLGGFDILGTEGNDVICGSEGADRIYGGGGNDIIYGFGGNDQIYGGNGNDFANGGAGTDQCVAETRVNCEAGFASG